MGNTTAIEWTNASWNPWHGCTKVSPGCAHCYMYRDKAHYGQDPTAVVRSKTTFTAPLKWREPRRVFTCSWSDFFHATADPWRDDAWDVIRRTPHLTYQILTKRPERIADHLPADWGAGWEHVWLGTSVENQHWADVRVPLLLSVPAVVRFLSCEPLLGPVRLAYDWLSRRCGGCFGDGEMCPVGCNDGMVEAVDWVIVGGESGPGARPMHPAWVSGLRDQCNDAGVAFFFKQWGEWVPEGASPYFRPEDALTLNLDGTTTPAAHGPYPAGHRTLHHVGKVRAGRLLDGRTWNEFPT